MILVMHVRGRGIGGTKIMRGILESVTCWVDGRIGVLNMHIITALSLMLI